MTGILEVEMSVVDLTFQPAVSNRLLPPVKVIPRTDDGWDWAAISLPAEAELQDDGFVIDRHVAQQLAQQALSDGLRLDAGGVR